MMIISNRKYCKFSKLSIENRFEKSFFYNFSPTLFYLDYILTMLN